MLHAKINKSLLAAQLSMWLPLVIFFLPSRLMGDSMLLLLLPVIAGWALAPVSALWNLVNALRSLGTAGFDPWVLRTAARHKIAMLPALAFNALLWFGAPLAMFNPWTMVLLPIAAVAIFFSVCCAWLSVLSTSVLVIGQLLLLWRQKALPLGKAAVHALLQLLFVLDILSCLALRSEYAPAPTPAPPGNQSQSSPDPASAAYTEPPQR